MNTDPKLKEALAAQLNYWIGRSANNVQLMVNDGKVTLRGCVPNYAEKKECVETVRRVGGVTEVTDEIVVEVPETRQRTDAEIVAAAGDAIKWITTVPLDSIKITALDGKLLLEGVVEELQQKQLVELVVRHVPGVVEITNLITIELRPLQACDEFPIKSAFEKHELLNAA